MNFSLPHSRSYFPMLSIFIFILIQTLPFYLLHSNILFPALHAIAIYFWRSYRPELLPYWFVFIMGLLQDILVGLPLGLTALLNLIFCVLIYQYPYQKKETDVPFLNLWSRFTSLFTVVLLIKWLLLAILSGTPIFSLILCLHLAITVASYPLFHTMLGWTWKVLPEHAKYQ